MGGAGGPNEAMADFRLPHNRPALMGVLNVTPDSFSDGGLFTDPRAAIDHAYQMVDQGADLIDVGGESTRPGAEPVDADQELRRVAPVIERLAADGLAVSIDTSKASVALRALELGAKVVNDVTALADPEMAEVCASHGCFVCLMHMQGTPRTMQHDPRYDDVVMEVRSALLDWAAWAQSKGIAAERIWIDPGIGFGKSVEHNLSLLRRLDLLVSTGYPVLVGVSRKTFIGRLLGTTGDPLPTSDRLEGTLAAQVLAQAAGVRIIRAHDVLSARRAIDLAAAVLHAE